jgi:hypothetical protein
MWKLDRPLLSIVLWIRDLLSMQHPMNTNTGTCVEMVGMSVTERPYRLGDAESHACGSHKPLQGQVAPARPSQGTFLVLMHLQNTPVRPLCLNRFNVTSFDHS